MILAYREHMRNVTWKKMNGRRVRRLHLIKVVECAANDPANTRFTWSSFAKVSDKVVNGADLNNACKTSSNLVESVASF